MQQFITASELSSMLGTSFEHILRQRPLAIETAISAAISKVAGMLATRFNTHEILYGFSASTGSVVDGYLPDGRHAELVFHTTNIAAYFLSYSLDPRNISEKWLRGYEDAVAWLQGVAAGKITVNFPVRELREGTNNDLTVRGGDIALTNNYNY